jgi:hypothetical protein
MITTILGYPFLLASLGSSAVKIAANFGKFIRGSDVIMLMVMIDHLKRSCM